MKEFEMLVSALRAKTTLSNIGIFDEKFLYHAAVRIVHRSGVQCGCGVLLAPNWVLTISHCVAGRLPELEVALAGELPATAFVKAIHWRSGEKYNAGGAWPANVETMFGQDDRFVLLKLSSNLNAKSGPAIPVVTSIPSKTPLLLAALGQTGEGEYPILANLTDVDYLCECKSGRGAVVPSRCGCHPGIPLSDDSGSPLFLGDCRQLQRLVGLLASIGPAKECCEHADQLPQGEQIAQFLRIRNEDVSWIDSIMHPTNVAQAEAKAGTSRMGCFIVRQTPSYPTICHRFKDPSDLYAATGKAWLLDIVPKPKYLYQCDKVELTANGNMTKMVISQRASGRRLEADLAIGMTNANGEIYFLKGKGTNNNLLFYAFAYRYRKDSAGNIRRGIRIEVFVPGTTFVLPEKTIRDIAECPRDPVDIVDSCPWTASDSPLKEIRLVPYQDLQDDDGNGFEDPYP